VVLAEEGLMTYKDRSFEDRWKGAWAREAQAAYELDRNMTRIPFATFGLNRAPFSVEALMAAPITVRYAPDYQEEVEKRLRYVEVKGCGRDGIIKLKQEQLVALWETDTELDVWFCLWNGRKRTLIDISIDEVTKVASQAERDGNMGVFDPDTAPKPYYELEWDVLAANGEEHGLGQ